MDLIERYVQQVSRYLPYGRSDIPAELRSLLRDALDARAAGVGRAPDEAMAVDVLRDFGDPWTVAQRYEEPESLIGPRIYPAYESIVFGLVTIPAVVAVAGRLVAWLLQGRPILAEQILPGIWGYTKYMFIAIGVTTVIFAIFERLVGAGDEEAEEADWDPRALPALAKPDPYRSLYPLALASALWGLVIALVVLNLFPEWIGMPFRAPDRAWGVIPAADLGIHLPEGLLNVYWGSALFFTLVLRALWVDRRWTRLLRGIQVGLGLFALVVLAVIIRGMTGPIIDDAYYASRAWTAGPHLQQLAAMAGKFNRVFYVVMWILVVLTTLRVAERIWRLLATRS